MSAADISVVFPRLVC